MARPMNTEQLPRGRVVGGQRRITNAIEGLLPMAIRRMLRKILRRAPPDILLGRVVFGDFRRLTPIGANFGLLRGQPVDRHYIEGFLARHRGDIQGHVLEVKDSTYSRRYGDDRVTRCSVLDVSSTNPLATHIADLAQADSIPSDTFDCIVLTQTLHLIYDFKSALRHLHRILKPGGTLLLTTPGISQLDEGPCQETWHWSFTRSSIKRMMAESFGEENAEIAVHGNVLAAVSFLMGLASSELTPEELDAHDPTYPMIITVRAKKPAPRAGA